MTNETKKEIAAFLRDYEKMCEMTDCDKCPMINKACGLSLRFDANSAIAAVEKWRESRKPKTDRGICLRGSFTRWYWRKGYRYNFETGESKCPRYVRPFRFLLSPGVYHSLSVADAFVAGWMDGLRLTLEKLGGSLAVEDSGKEE